jgi:hypothetical protein
MWKTSASPDVEERRDDVNGLPLDLDGQPPDVDARRNDSRGPTRRARNAATCGKRPDNCAEWFASDADRQNSSRRRAASCRYGVATHRQRLARDRRSVDTDS